MKTEEELLSAIDADLAADAPSALERLARAAPPHLRVVLAKVAEGEQRQALAAIPGERLTVV